MRPEDYLEGFIKCPKCGEVYKVEKVDLTKESVFYTCNCGAQIPVSFFTYCSECQYVVGVDNGINTFGAAAKEFGRGFLKGLNPVYSAKWIARSFDKKTPYDHGSGNCLFCNTKYARCPNCHSGVEIGPDTKSEDIVFCTECGKKFRLQ
ncbi:MAG: hypothetical protein IKN31_01130 [Bacteroidales bacterium]|nr:hypothetical protein [Bacteroidales bacterium]